LITEKLNVWKYESGMKKLLLVEDEPIMAVLTKQQLEQNGYIVLHCSTGEEAVEKISNYSENIDLVLMDINLGNGIEGTEAAKQILKKVDIPILFLSSHTESEIVEKTERITSYGYVVKNSGFFVLNASIKMAFRLHEAKLREIEKESALKQSEERFHNLFERAPLGYQSLDENGFFIEANQAWMEMLGYERDDVIGKWFGDFLEDGQVDLFRERFPLFKRNGCVVTEFAMKHKDGTIRNIAFNGRIGYKNDGSFEKTHCILRDNTETRAAGKKLEQANERLQIILNSIDAFIYIADMQSYELLFINDYGLKNWGENITGKICYKELQGFDKPCPFCTNKYLLNADGTPSGVYRWEFQNTKNGCWYEIIDRAIRWTDDRVVRMEIAVDITDKKQSEIITKNQLKEKEILLKEVHHRIKNSINSIDSLLQIQLADTANEEVKRILNDSVSRVAGMKLVYEKLLITEDYSVLSVKEYVSDLAEAIIRLYSKSVKIIKEIDDFEISVKKIFPLGAIVNELVTNSLKYAFVENLEPLIEIFLKKNEDKIFLKIRDNGKGYPEEAKNSKMQVECLGLTLIRLFTEQLGGTYRFENENGASCTIDFSL